MRLLRHCHARTRKSLRGGLPQSQSHVLLWAAPEYCFSPFKLLQCPSDIHQTQIPQTEDAFPLIQSSVSLSFMPPQSKHLILGICTDGNPLPNAHNLINGFWPELLPRAIWIENVYTFQQGPLLSKSMWPIILCLDSPGDVHFLTALHSSKRLEISTKGAWCHIENLSTLF